jgi:SulP family sulfate permease
MDLAVAVVVGIIVSSLIFSWNSGATLTVERSVQKIDDGEEMCTYEVSGSLFFASIQPFMESFTERDDPKHVRVNFDNCDIYDWSAIEAINALNAKYDDLDKKVQFKQIKLSSRKIMAKARLLLKEQVSVATFVEGEDIVVGKPNKIGSGFVTRDSKSD